MERNRLISLMVLGSVSIAPPAAQNPSPTLEQVQAIDAARWMVAVHTGADEAVADYGTWAAGPDYKVSFHDGMVFYPVLGADAPRNLPVRWRTTGVSIGGHQLMTSDAAKAMRGHAQDWRYEYRYPGFTEAYDVRRDGVEQTFVIAQRPAVEGSSVRGDLVVRGQLISELDIDSATPRSGALALRDATGRERVRYGAAIAIDAAGRQTAMTTTIVAGEVELRLAADAVRDAQFPLTVDPLLSARSISAGGATPADTEIGRDAETGQLMIVFTRAVSSADYDGYAYLMDDDFSPSAPVFTDITASWSTDSMDVAYVAAPQRWVIGFNRLVPSSNIGYLRAHLHDAGNFSVSTSIVALRSTDWAHHIAVGGCSNRFAGDEALVVYRSDSGQPDTNNSSIRATVVDVRAGRAIRHYSVSSTSVLKDTDRPDINEQRESSGDDWVCVFQSLDTIIPQDDWDVFATRVDQNGSSNSYVSLGNLANAMHSFAPRIAGSLDNYSIAYLQRANLFPQIGNTGSEAWVQVLQWGVQSSLPTSLAHERLRQGRALLLGGVAHDRETRSHYACVTSETLAQPLVSYVDRIGVDGKIAESASITPTSGAAHPSITYDDDNHEYSIAYASTAVVSATKLAYPAINLPAPYGTGCGNASISSATNNHANLPWAGTRNFIARITGAPSGVNGVLLIGGAQTNLDLSFIGMTGCPLLVDPTQAMTTLNVVLPTSSYNQRLTIPSTVSGTIYMQWLYVSPGSNPFGAQMTGGLTVDIR